MLIYAARESILEQICKENGNAIFYVKIIKKDSFKRMSLLKKLLCSKGSINISGFYTYFSLSVLRVCD